ncbi:MAG: hypothetical protein KDJ31_09335 [Candidatus Competibacteraceae bacterium]|nr:hypothetical protein [Candidatus Competibacteraceae bacterium]
MKHVIAMSVLGISVFVCPLTISTTASDGIGMLIHIDVRSAHAGGSRAPKGLAGMKRGNVAKAFRKAASSKRPIAAKANGGGTGGAAPAAVRGSSSVIKTAPSIKFGSGIKLAQPSSPRAGSQPQAPLAKLSIRFNKAAGKTGMKKGDLTKKFNEVAKPPPKTEAPMPPTLKPKGPKFAP